METRADQPLVAPDFELWNGLKRHRAKSLDELFSTAKPDYNPGLQRRKNSTTQTETDRDE